MILKELKWDKSTF